MAPSGQDEVCILKEGVTMKVEYRTSKGPNPLNNEVLVVQLQLLYTLPASFQFCLPFHRVGLPPYTSQKRRTQKESLPSQSKDLLFEVRDLM